MDLEQIQKRIEWLDEERRNDKGTIADLQKKVNTLEGLLEKSGEEIKNLSSEITHLNVVVTRIDSFDDSLVTHRKDVKKSLDAQEKKAKDREKYAKKTTGDQVDELRKEIKGLDNQLTTLLKLREEAADIKEENSRLQRLINENKESAQKGKELNAETQNSVRTLLDDNRTFNKGFTDLKGEVAALRKRADENRSKLGMISEGQKKADTRLSEMSAAEMLRKETQDDFLEKITRMDDDRKKMVRDWEKRMEKVAEQSAQLENTLIDIGEAERKVQQANQKFTEITEQISRRIHEITEMQRLAEEHFRQEWSTFKADDQKRWTNYTLTQDEHHRDINRQSEQLENRITDLEELSQNLQEIVQYTGEENKKRMQTLLNLLRDWIAEGERLNKTTL